MRVVIALPVAGLVVGAAIGLQLPDLPVGWALAVMCGSCLIAVHAARVSRSVLIAISAAVAFASGGEALAAGAWHDAWRPSLRLVFEAIAHDARADAIRAGLRPPEDAAARVIVDGVLQADASRTASGAVSLLVDLQWIGRVGGANGRTDPAANPVTGGVLLTVLGSRTAELMGEWRAGRRIRAPVELHRVACYLDPGVPDQERVMARRGVSLVGSVKSAMLVSVTSRGSPADELAGALRSYARRAFAESIGVFSPRAAAIVSAIVIGDRTGLDAQTERRLQESGTYHVIAISGGNIALLAGFTLALFRIAGVLGRGAMLSGAAALIAYGFLVGGGASVNRAVMMTVVYLVGRSWDMRGPPFQVLALVAGILILVDPLSVADPATLLTFGATTAIVSTAPIPLFARLPRPLATVAALFAASAAAEIALLPIAAALFSRVTFAGLLLNFGAVPLMALAQLAGMAVVPLFALSPTAAQAAGWIAWVGAEGLVRTANLVEYAQWSTWRVAPPGLILLVIYYGAIVSSWFAWRTNSLAIGVRLRSAQTARLRLAATLVAAAAGVWIVVNPFGFRGGDGKLHVTFIDVGQGDAAIVRLPRGSSMLIDAGGLPGSSSFDIGDRIVGPVLRSLGVRRLGTIVLTHADADHAGGAGAVLREFRAWDIWDGVPVPRLESVRQLQNAAAASGTRWTTVQRSDTSITDDVRVTVVHPEVPDWERQVVRNDDSIVLELRWRDVSFVFTGDIGRETEPEISRLLQPAPLRVVKVPHHGSNTSSSDAFVRALRPDVAVISVGRSNNFGHPSPLVLRRYEDTGAQIFRTDQDGAVTIDTDGVGLTVTTFLGRTVHVASRRHHEGQEGV
jgi:competence protein ComEC